MIAAAVQNVRCFQSRMKQVNSRQLATRQLSRPASAFL